MKYKLVIFDFVGTIADTSEYILDSYRYILAAMKREIPSEKVLCEVIGGAFLEICRDWHSQRLFKYYGAADPPVRYGVSHLSGLTEPLVYSYSA